MASVLRIPISNTLMGGDYTFELLVNGSPPVNLLLDTGSSMLVLDGAAYDLAKDPNAATTQLVQTASFQSGAFLASVVRTSVGLAAASAEPPIVLPNASVAVTYDNRPGTFGQADGIFGLAYAALDTAYRMPADTWKNRYTADQLALGQHADLDHYLSQAAAAGLIAEKFAFAVHRSVTSQALGDPAADPLNNGLFVLGGGLDCSDLYTGEVSSVAVVHQQYYNTNLLAVQVGDEAISVPTAAPGARVASNSIIDSGASNITLDQGLYQKVIGLFGAVNPDLATALETFGPTSTTGCNQNRIDLTRWPPLRFIFQGSDTSQVRITVTPENYWQFDSISPGVATTVLCGDNGMLGGQCNLGLPIFCGHYVAFDRTASNGHGVISFAASTASPQTATATS